MSKSLNRPAGWNYMDTTSQTNWFKENAKSLSNTEVAKTWTEFNQQTDVAAPSKSPTEADANAKPDVEKPAGWEDMPTEAQDKWRKEHPDYKEPEADTDDKPETEDTNETSTKTVDYKDFNRFDTTVVKREAYLCAKEHNGGPYTMDEKGLAQVSDAVDYYITEMAKDNTMSRDELEKSMEEKFPDVKFETITGLADEAAKNYLEFQDKSKELSDKLKDGQAKPEEAQKFVKDNADMFYACDMIKGDKYKDLTGLDAELPAFDTKKHSTYKLPESPKFSDYVTLVKETASTFISNLRDKFSSKTKERTNEARAELGDIVDASSEQQESQTQAGE